MSLQLAAQHLQAHGRGQDDQLVHMTSGELDALQKLAQAHGGSLTLNPNTGLPEAGFLGGILPTVLGAAGAIFLPEIDPLLLAGGIGVADAALTGSLGQGLMAGLGAWGGSSLAQGFSAIGDPNAPFNATQDSVQNAGQGEIGATQNIATDTGMGNTGNFVDTTGGGMTTSQGLGINLSSPDVTGGITGSGQAVNPNVQNAFPSNAPTAGPTPAQALPNVPTQSSSFLPDSMQQNWNKFSSGFNNATGSWDAFKNFASNNKWPLIGVGTTVAGAAMQAMRPDVPTGPIATGETNPMHLKVNPQWSGPTQPAQPNPYYVAQYPNYVKNPYNPMTAAGGGLMNVATYKSGGSADDPQSIYDAMKAINEGVAMASPSKAEMPSSHMAYHTNAHDNGIYKMSDADYAATTPTAIYKQYVHDPASLSMAQIAQQSPATSAKEGGLAYADGGVTHLAAGSQPVNYKVPNSGNFLVDPNASAAASPFGTKGKGNPTSSQFIVDPTKLYDSFGATVNPNTSQMMAAKGKGKPAQTTTPVPSTTPAVNEVPINTNIYIPKYAHGGMSMGGLGDLGSYSDGGRLLKGPGDGVSDSIPASIGHKQPARLAEGEFVIPARIVSELGNGSTDAGAKRLYAMMDRVKAKRAKTKDIAADTKAYNYLPA
jgi:hypothetical protein